MSTGGFTDNPKLIKEIMTVVTIPVFARIGHFAEAQIQQSLGLDMIDESESNLIL
jgi:pyridoxal 5'-phosphate synthase pdxS subunit